MIDLDAWEREQHRRNQLAAEFAMWRLGRRYDWPVPHPMQHSMQRIVRKLREDFGLVFTSVAEQCRRTARHINLVTSGDQ